MDGLHSFSTFFTTLFSLAFFGFILLVSYLIYALKGKKYYNNVLSLTIIYLILMPPALGGIDPVARIIIKYIFLIPLILIFIIINIVIYLLIKKKKIEFKCTYNDFYQFLYRIFFLISIVFSIVSVFEQLIYHIDFDIFYYIISSCNNLYICIIISTMIMYLLGVTNVRTIKKCLKNLALYVVIYNIIYALLLYLLYIIKINVGNVFYLLSGIIKWIFAGLIFVKNIEMNDITVLSKINNNKVKSVLILLAFVIINYFATKILLLLDSLFWINVF